jgi:hypothetical protein
MNAFVFDLPNRPGEMARVTEALAARGINILIYDLGLALGVVASDEGATRSTFDDLGVAIREVPIVTVRMEDRPGQAASISRRLADAGVNIEIWLPVDTSPESFIVALGVDDIEAARAAVREQIIEWSYQ